MVALQPQRHLQLLGGRQWCHHRSKTTIVVLPATAPCRDERWDSAARGTGGLRLVLILASSLTPLHTGRIEKAAAREQPAFLQGKR